MLIEIDPAEVKLEAESLDELFIVSATWHGIRAGVAKCLWDDAEKTRLLLADLEVEGERVVERRRFFRAERRASFRGLGIGKRLLREVIEQAPRLGARELVGKVVALDLKPRPFLLDWYAREGFEICEPIAGDKIPHEKSIVMRFG